MLDKAKCGRLGAEDFHIAVKAVSEGRVSPRDLYTALHVVGLAGSPTQAEVVRKYLDMPSDPMLSRLALQILCDYWGMSSDVLPEIHRFLTGVGWDIDGDVREVAISVAGRHLREERGPRSLAQALVRIAEDEGELDFVRESAVRALAGALGESLLDVSSPAVRVRIPSAQAVDVLTRARKRYAVR
ncbi:hypothetical protein ACFPM3_20585 [Streptomyces coeruleoprunus]|uniref:HEAT repeat domain-containing protein n=1 Tax=Streptomyces coeruleoprunus TaxID=285563 RepID=A0ABV9XGQ3_9ACTN